MTEKPEIIVIDGGMVNAYLLKSDDRFVLIDTLTKGKRSLVEKALADAGCSAGKLELIVATHADSDHIGNCAYLRDELGGAIGMHREEAPVAQTGDMTAARPNVSGLGKFVFSVLGSFFRPADADRFTPDVYLGEGDDLTPYGLDAKVLYLPGHSQGSISVLTAQGDLFCGDLMTNTRHPKANSLVDDPVLLAESVARVRGLGVRTVYPGHGKPFDMSELV